MIEKEDVKWLCFKFREMMKTYNVVLWHDDLDRLIKIEKTNNVE